MSSNSAINKVFTGKRVIIPILFGLLIAVYFAWDDFNWEELKSIPWRKGAGFWILASLGMMVLRDLGYILRLRILSEKRLSVRQCLEISLLWEFASAVSPSAIGGTAVAVVIMAQENLQTGLTTAIVLLTAFLDELFYIIMVPLTVIFVGWDLLFPVLSNEGFEGFLNPNSLRWFFWTGYVVIFVWTIFLGICILYRPSIARGILLLIYRLPFLRKRKEKGMVLADDLLKASNEFRAKNIGFWLRAFGATFLSWSARFLMLNCLMMAFAGFDNHFLVYARQLVMWVILMVSITPGGSGIAEGIFPFFMRDFLPGKQISRLVAIVWRILSYYPYLFIGMVLLPIWLKRVRKFE
jgi:uncharacterized protein (TIRG00374 family)